MKLLIEGYHYSPEAIKSLGRLMGNLTWRDGTKSKDYADSLAGTYNFTDCDFVHNAADTRGGAISINSSNVHASFSGVFAFSLRRNLSVANAVRSVKSAP